MLKEDTVPVQDAETEFRRRLAEKLKNRGYSGKALEDEITRLLHKGVNLKLDLRKIIGA